MSIPFKKTLGVLISIFAANTVIAADFLTEGKIAAVEEDYKDGLMADDSEDLSLGKVEAAESMAALDLADQISKTIQKKYNQDS
ncbi:MAG: hypothetical protein ACXVCP_20305, partial [Bdellovibrio sp.]